jgi:hypothetical protein
MPNCVLDLRKVRLVDQSNRLTHDWGRSRHHPRIAFKMLRRHDRKREGWLGSNNGFQSGGDVIGQINPNAQDVPFPAFRRPEAWSGRLMQPLELRINSVRRSISNRSTSVVIAFQDGIEWSSMLARA